MNLRFLLLNSLDSQNKVEEAYDMMQQIKAEFVKPESTETVVASLKEACQPVFASIETKYAAYRREYLAQ